MQPSELRTYTWARHSSAAAVAVLTVFGVALVAHAHDFWLVPDAFRIAEGGYVEVRGQTSSRFPTSESAVALDRVADARLISASGSERIGEMSRRGTSLFLRHRPTIPGQRVVAVTLRPRSIRESAAGFRRYLELEGAPEALARIEREGLLRGRDSVTRRYAKYAKTVVEVGSGGARAFSAIARHPLEFVPRGDPARLVAGDTAAIQLLYRGQPLSGAAIHAGAVSRRGRPGTTQAGSGEASLDSIVAPDVHLTTDASGVLRLPINAAGLWNVRTIHVVQADQGSGADWDTHWATLVFEAGEHGAGAERSGASRAGTPRSDSSEVANVVARYHEALAVGDSATALSLLASDAVVLESGEMETREEYRSHHLPADIQFARAVRSERSPLRVTLRGDVAWVSSTSTAQGQYRGRAVNSAGAELMVLTREADGWRIRAIHWSSRTRRTPG
ncbi:MAG TPA: DUF4198 domain-containing protein [Dehalococcoidia bacterium]|nr:DUF4198 domain-containing protein [Dehalococcoidia bacterium]